MVLQGLQLTDPVLGRAANNLALALDHPVQINAYLSPAAARGLELHFDFHDVFVLQLEGRKRWRVWAPLPRTRDPVRTGSEDPAAHARRARRADARPDAHERRLPLPAARLPARRRDHRRGVVAPDDRCARDHLAACRPPGPRRGRRGRGAHRLDPGAQPRRDRFRSRPIRSRLGSHLDPASLRPWLAKEIWHRQPATRLRPLVPPEIRVDTPVALTPGPLLWLTTMTRSTGCRAVFGLGDRELDLPAEAHPLLAELARPSGFVRRRLGGRRPGRGLAPGGRAAARRRGSDRSCLAARPDSSARSPPRTAPSRCGPPLPRSRRGCSSRCTARGVATRWTRASSARTPRRSGATRCAPGASVSSRSGATSTPTTTSRRGESVSSTSWRAGRA